MLIAEYDYDTDIAVQRKESLMIGIQQGIERGFAEGAYKKAVESARILKQLCCDTAMITQATGLSQSEIENL